MSPRRAAVFFESFDGTGAGDGPRAVCDRLVARGSRLDLWWSVEDRSVPVPVGSRPVLRGTPEWFEALGSARLVVADGTLPELFVKAPGQTYVQTWHGTPVKRLGRDVDLRNPDHERYTERLVREARSWDLLVSSSPFATEVFRRAFGYEGEIAEVGRPSNDVLVDGRGPAIRAELRSRLGLTDADRAVLYAPTWRDDRRDGGSSAPVHHLDTGRLRALAPDVTVLMRQHPTSSSRRREAPSPGVVDVTSYPDIADLYLASDALVTDYSAAMVDFAVTDKPVVLLVPDLDRNRNEVRGLDVDLGAMAPGPLVRTTDEVAEALAADTGSERRAAVRREFAPYDDGHVADRLLQRLGETVDLA